MGGGEDPYGGVLWVVDGAKLFLAKITQLQTSSASQSTTPGGGGGGQTLAEEATPRGGRESLWG